VAGTNTSETVTVNNGDDSFDIHGLKTIVDLLDAAGLDYKFYSEDYPTSGQCFFGSGYGNESNSFETATNRLYRRKHNPIVSFDTYYNSPARCSTQRDFNDLARDLADGNLPAFSFVVPNQANDGHDTSIDFTATWLQPFLQNQFFASPAFNTSRVLLHIAYDEATIDLDDGVYSTLLGNAIPANLVNSVDKNYYNHYSVLATVEANWGLGNLGRGDVAEYTIPFALSAASENTFTPNVTCNVCGQKGYRVTNTSYVFPPNDDSFAKVSCGQIEDMGLAGEINCVAQGINDIVVECGCIYCLDDFFKPFPVQPLGQKQTCQWLQTHVNTLVVKTSGLVVPTSTIPTGETWGTYLCAPSSDPASAYNICAGTCHKQGCSQKCADSATKTFKAGKFGRKGCAWLFANRRNWDTYCGKDGSGPAATICPNTCSTCL
jgi:hypothetical protein